MSKEYYILNELIDNNGGLLNDESLHFIARHSLLCELLLCDNRLGEEAFLAFLRWDMCQTATSLRVIYICATPSIAK